MGLFARLLRLCPLRERIALERDQKAGAKAGLCVCLVDHPLKLKGSKESYRVQLGNCELINQMCLNRKG